MFVIRPAGTGDQDQVSAMVRARADWLHERGLNGSDGWRNFAEDYGRQAADSGFPVWVLTRDDKVVGATCLYEESPAWFWTEAERAEPAFFVASTVTHPALAGQRVGYLMLRWVLDHAARTGKRWVRRGTWEPGLVRYYTQVQGWTIVRQKERDGVVVTGLARLAELQPDLGVRAAVAVE
ncbi:MAG: hypothetical protein GEV03_06760 [Streptosporangiales bacterium]|nr:hypothetical protein [Streptosporangiales bacterium]